MLEKSSRRDEVSVYTVTFLKMHQIASHRIIIHFKKARLPRAGRCYFRFEKRLFGVSSHKVQFFGTISDYQEII